MPTSRRELVLQAFKTQLSLINTVTTGPAVTVARNVDDAITAPPAVVMVDGGMTKNAGEVGGEITGQDRYLLRVGVYGYVSNATDEGLGGDISDLNARIARTMLADVSLGGTAGFMREATDAMDDPDYDHERGRRPNAAFMSHFEIEFITRQGDPFELP